MIKIITTVLFMSIALITSAQDTFTVTVKINNATSDSGKMVINLSNEKTFMGPAPFMAASSEIKDGHAVITFKNVPAGEYAVIALHDLNGNNAMDFEPTGMPKEDYGTSSNTITYGPPQWSDAKFDLKADKELTIRL